MVNAAAARNTVRRLAAATALGLNPAAAAAASPASAARAQLLHPPSRSFFGLFGKKKADGASSSNPFRQPRSKPAAPILSQDNLFHPLSKSPIPAMRARGERVRSLSPCPVNLAKGKRKLVAYECPLSGWPTHATREDWEADPEKGKYIPRLREANEDEHDLRSGREMKEFELPGPQGFEETINFSSWDIFFYTRNHNSIETDRSRRHVSKLLTFPATVAGVLHENSPYTKRSRRLTHEGLRSMIALRQTLHPRIGDKPSLDVVRVFVVGARAESSLPPAVWDQLTYMFPGVPVHLFLIGPEAILPPDDGRASAVGKAAGSAPTTTVSAHKNRQRTSNYGFPSRTTVISEGLTITTIQALYEDVHAQLEPFDPYTDVFFAFSPGFGFPSQLALKEAQRAREEDEAMEKRMREARETYFAKGAEGIEAEAELQRGSTDEGKPFQAMEGTPAPEGGDIPSAEPAPAIPADRSNPHLMALTAAPVVQAQAEWARAITQILSTKCAMFVTGFSPADIERDVLAFESLEGVRDEIEWLLTPGENVFASQQWAIADFDVRVAIKNGYGIWGVRGKRYDVSGPRADWRIRPQGGANPTEAD